MLIFKFQSPSFKIEDFQINLIYRIFELQRQIPTVIDSFLEGCQYTFKNIFNDAPDIVNTFYSILKVSKKGCK